MNADLLQGFYLGKLLVEPLTGKVTGPSGNVHLGPKAAEVLLQLASSPGELVTRERLLEQAWGEGQGTHESLSRAIAEIRHAFDDQEDNPTYIQTLPRRGYRLIVTPESVTESTSSVVIGANDGVRVGDIGILENLKRRGVIETAIAYLIVGWLIIQIVDSVFEQLHLPTWAGTFVTVLVIAGFPIAVSLSWYLEFRGGDAVFDNMSAVEARRRRFSRTYLSVIGALAVAAVLVFAYDRYVGLPEGDEPAVVDNAELVFEPPPVTENSIAVLPFMNIDGSDDTQIFANGLVDDVLTRLAQVRGLRVSARGDSFSLEPNSPSDTVRTRLRVAHYLEGSVQMSGDRLRVIVQLIDSKTGFHVMSRSFDRQPEDFFDVRDEITSLTVASMRPALPPKTRDTVVQAVEDPVLDAYLLYRNGVEVSRLPTSIDSITSALSWFDRALEVDPDYAAAYAGKCSTYARGYAEVDDPSYIELAESSCARALDLNPNLDVVHVALGRLYESTGQYGESIAAYQDSLKIDPFNVDALIGLGNVYVVQNEPGLAEQSFRQATGLFPGDANTYNWFGSFLYRQGRYRDAVEQYRIAVSMNPNDMNSMTNLGTSYLLLGEFGLARTAFDNAIRIEPRKHAWSNLSLVDYYLGNYDEAEKSVTNAISLEPKDHLPRSNLGDILWAAGAKERARASYEHARTLCESALSVNPNDPYLLMDLAWISAMLDDFERAQGLVERFMQLVPGDAYSHYYAGLIAARQGQDEIAIAALSKAADGGLSRALMAAEPHLANLRQHPQFIQIVNK